MVEQISTNDCPFVLVGENARTGKRLKGWGDGRVLGVYNMDVMSQMVARPLYTYAVQ